MSKKSKVKNSELNNLIFTEADLQKLAHAGTKEAIAKLEAYMESENNLDKKAYAEMALEECEFFYYQPQNEKEERDFLLCKIISEYQLRLDKLEMKVNETLAYLEKYELEQDIHKKVLDSHKNKKEDWEYRHMDDFAVWDRNHLNELEDDMVYKKAFIDAAKKMILTPKYKNGIPERHISHYDFGFGGDEFEDDCCDEVCPKCGSDDIDFKF